MTPITLEMLTDSLQKVQIPQAGWMGIYFTLFDVYWTTGCRSSEALLKDRWSMPGDGYVYLQPLKGNSQRQFTVPSIPADFKQWIVGENNLFDRLTQRRVEYAFQMLYDYPTAHKGRKESVLYLFRYHFVKRAFALGFTVSQITGLMGWSSESIALGYINAELYYT